MKIKMLTYLGRGPFGRWPAAGEAGDVPDEHAAHAIEHGFAVPVADAPKAERATSTPPEKRSKRKR